MYCCWAELDPRLHDQSTNQRRHITEGRIVSQQCRASRVGFRWGDITVFIHARATWWRDFGANDEQQIISRVTTHPCQLRRTHRRNVIAQLRRIPRTAFRAIKMNFVKPRRNVVTHQNFRFGHRSLSVQATPSLWTKVIATKNDPLTICSHIIGETMHILDEFRWRNASIAAVLIDLIGRCLDYDLSVQPLCHSDGRAQNIWLR